MAYADDTVWLAKSKNEMTEIIAIAEEFFEINDIKINGNKFELIVFNSRTKKSTLGKSKEIQMGGVTVKTKEKEKTTRYLGIWLSEKKGKECYTEIVRKEVQQVMCAIQKKRMTLGQLVYINNRILISRLEYQLQCRILPENTCMNLHRPMLMMIKNKANLAKTLATF